MNALRNARSEIARNLTANAQPGNESGWNLSWLKRAAAAPLLVAAVAAGGLGASQPAKAFGVDLLVMGVKALANNPNAVQSAKKTMAGATEAADKMTAQSAVVVNGLGIIDKAREGVVDLNTERLKPAPVDAKRLAHFKRMGPLLADAIKEHAGASRAFYEAANNEILPKDTLKTMQASISEDRQILADFVGEFANARMDIKKAGKNTAKEDAMVTAALTQFTPEVSRINKAEFDRVALSTGGLNEAKAQAVEGAKKAGAFFNSLMKQGAEKVNGLNAGPK